MRHGSHRELPMMLVHVSAIVAAACPSFAAETLYNGIVLPDEWPPHIKELNRDPMPVPYLENRPEVILIDVSRQLFVDDFLVMRGRMRTWRIGRERTRS